MSFSWNKYNLYNKKRLEIVQKRQNTSVKVQNFIRKMHDDHTANLIKKTYGKINIPHLSKNLVFNVYQTIDEPGGFSPVILFLVPVAINSRLYTFLEQKVNSA